MLECSANSSKITVGDHILLTCNGSFNSNFIFDKVNFKSNELKKYEVKLLKVISVRENIINFEMTYYSQGEHKLSELVLTDGEHEIELSGSPILVESVIVPKNDGKPTDPFGPILPIRITTPSYYYFSIIFFVLSMILFGVFKLKRFLYYKKLREKLLEYNSPVAPDTQFYKAIRSAEKEHFPIEQIEKAFRLYNLRTYQLPVFELPNNQLIRYFKRNFPGHIQTRNSLSKLLEEFEELGKRDGLTLYEKNEFIKKLYRYVEINSES